MKISAFIITKNEERCIARCLESLGFVDEVIVIDSGSTDKTIEIVKSFNKTKLFEVPWQGFAAQKQVALNKCSHSFCLSLDADEWITGPLAKEIVDANWNDYDAFYIPRLDYFKNKLPPSLVKKEKGLRLFKKELAHFHQVEVHETVHIESKKIGFLTTPYIHDGYNDPSILKKKLKTYAKLASKNKKKNLAMISLIPPKFLYVMFSELFLKRRILFGSRGIHLGFLNSYYSILKIWYRSS